MRTHNKDTAWKLECSFMPEFDDLKLVHLKDVTHSYPPHVHEDFCIAMVMRGTETLICKGNSHLAEAGSLLYVNAGEVHSSLSVGAEYKTIQIKPRFIHELLFGETHRLNFPRSVINDPAIFQTFLRLYSNLQQKKSYVEKEAELVAAFEALLRERSADHVELTEPQAVAKVRRHLRSRFAENIPLTRLAEIADLSPFHLVRIFRNHIGIPPHEYQIQVRVVYAQRMLLHGHSISEAATASGFFDQSHFTRNFKRITGFTPGRYLAHSNIVQDN